MRIPAMTLAFPRPALRFTGGNKLDALGGVLSVRDGVVLDVVDKQEFVAIFELGGHLRTGVSPPRR